MTEHHDVAIIGSGFSGSILAWILASRGRSVALIDPVAHPRFAIGESSTPIADLLLRRLGERHGLPALVQLSTHGRWQDSHPEIACGRKRGFSYYMHESGKPFTDTPDHQRSLLVAASANDQVADTHWYRRDVDQFLFQQAIAAGATCYRQSVTGLKPDAPNRLTLGPDEMTADWVIDATGRACVTASLLKAPDLTDQLKTDTRSMFGHYRNVRPWRDVMIESGIDCNQDPFDADDSAQHHLHPGGWIWMLRFNNGITSIGWTSSNSPQPITAQFPSFRSMMKDFQLVEPVGGPTLIPRLQKLHRPIVAQRCLMLPSTACTLDPLHSTGIAHSLAGVGRIADVILAGGNADVYAKSVLTEARFLDRLVSTAYRTMNDFPRFTAACMIYFAAAIACEERILEGEIPARLWNADDKKFVSIANSCCELLVSGESTPQVIDQIRLEIEPWNTAGLMDPSVNNRYAYTATK